MTIEELDAALAALGWKVADFCRATGLHRNTPSGWRNQGVPIPPWVPQHLGLLLDVRRLYAAAVTPASDKSADWLAQDLQRLHAAYLAPAGAPGAGD